MLPRTPQNRTKKSSADPSEGVIAGGETAIRLSVAETAEEGASGMKQSLRRSKQEKIEQWN
jgi:hypothetical protein